MRPPGRARPDCSRPVLAAPLFASALALSGERPGRSGASARRAGTRGPRPASVERRLPAPMQPPIRSARDLAARTPRIWPSTNSRAPARPLAGAKSASPGRRARIASAGRAENPFASALARSAERPGRSSASARRAGTRGPGPASVERRLPAPMQPPIRSARDLAARTPRIWPSTNSRAPARPWAGAQSASPGTRARIASAGRAENPFASALARSAERPGRSSASACRAADSRAEARFVGRLLLAQSRRAR